MVDQPLLDVAIVSYRCEALLRDCLESLRLHPSSGGMTVHVVDNASRDGTATMVARQFPDVTLTASSRNLGFAAASNLAIRSGEAPYVLCLNPDTRVHPGTLDRLLDRMEDRPEIGICGPRLERDDGSLDHAAKRAFPTPMSAVGHFTGLGRRRDRGVLAAYRAPQLHPNRAGPVDAVNGAFMLVRRAALDEAGLFDEGYWMYMEDLDLCYRFARRGWITWYEPSATATHVKAGTSGPHRALRLNYAFHYGMYRFYREHYAPERSWATNLAVYCGIALKFGASVLRSALARSRSRLAVEANPRTPARGARGRAGA